MTQYFISFFKYVIQDPVESCGSLYSSRIRYIYGTQNISVAGVWRRLELYFSFNCITGFILNIELLP